MSSWPDPDLFNRWEAGQDLARALIVARAKGAPDEVGENASPRPWAGLNDQASDPAFKALLPRCPAIRPGAGHQPADPAAIHAAREALRTRLSLHLTEDLKRLHIGLQELAEFSPDAASAGPRPAQRRAGPAGRQSPRRDRRTGRGPLPRRGDTIDAVGGLSALMLVGGEAHEAALADFIRSLEVRAYGHRQVVRLCRPATPTKAPWAGSWA